MYRLTQTAGIGRGLLAALASLVVLSGPGLAQQPAGDGSAAAHQIADFFSSLGDQIYEDCIFELSPEQVDVQSALIIAYIKQGASSAVARRLAVQQIQPPKLSAECERIRGRTKASGQIVAAAPPEAVAQPQIAAPTESAAPPQPATPSQSVMPSEFAGPTLVTEPEEFAAPVESAALNTATPPVAVRKPKTVPARTRQRPSAPPVSIANIKPLPQWDCDPNVDFVTIKLKGFRRKLTGGEICKPFEDVVNKVPDTARNFRLGYTIRTGRLFVDAEEPNAGGMTIAWALSGRDVCRNNPDPNCLGAKGIGPLPPGEYSFSAEKSRRVTWGPITKRKVAGIYLRKLWYKDRFNRNQTAAIMRRGNIAIHQRLKGEMSEACIGLEAKGWAYVASLIKAGRATGVNVYIDEPYPKLAGTPPVIVASSFSLTSLFK